MLFVIVYWSQGQPAQATTHHVTTTSTTPTGNNETAFNLEVTAAARRTCKATWETGGAMTVSGTATATATGGGARHATATSAPHLLPGAGARRAVSAAGARGVAAGARTKLPTTSCRLVAVPG